MSGLAVLILMQPFLKSRGLSKGQEEFQTGAQRREASLAITNQDTQ